ncbi:hypothetical protein NKH77_09195 [Streptomyces sp. M19]
MGPDIDRLVARCAARTASAAARCSWSTRTTRPGGCCGATNWRRSPRWWSSATCW